MRSHTNKFIGWAVLLGTVLYACGTSNINGGSGDDVGFDPSMNSSLQVLHFDAIKESLLVNFGLTAGSQSVSMLNSQQAIFDKPIRDYNSLFATNFTLIMAKACQEMDDEALFPNGAKIDTAWKKLTGRPVDEDAKELEALVLAKVAGKPEDVKIYSLCLAVALDAKSLFINYVE